MQRYFVQDTAWQENLITLDGDDAHHIKNVMRMDVGDRIICVHPSGHAAKCEIIELSTESIQTRIIEALDDQNELPIQVTIVQALPKRNKLEMILQKGTELGGHQFLLFQGDRSIVKWDHQKEKRRLERFRKITKEASEQCERNLVPMIEFTSLETILQEQQDHHTFLFAYEETARTTKGFSFSTVLHDRKPGDQLSLFIGPEGGFSPREANLLLEHGAIPIRLGPRILRTETASLYALASISYHFEELRCR